MLPFSFSLSLSWHQGLFQWVRVCITWPKYCSFSLSISLFNQYSGLILFRIDWFDLLAPKNSQESSLAPQFKSILSSVLRLLCGPTLTSLHDYWKLSSVLVVNSFRSKICCICLQSRLLWTVISPAMWLLLVLCSSFLCLAISIRLAKICKSVGSDLKQNFHMVPPKARDTGYSACSYLPGERNSPGTLTMSDAGLEDGMMPPQWQCLGMVKLLTVLQIFLELFLLLITVLLLVYFKRMEAVSYSNSCRKLQKKVNFQTHSMRPPSP